MNRLKISYNYFIVIRARLLRILRFYRGSCPNRRLYLSYRAVQKSLLMIIQRVLCNFFFNNRYYSDLWFFISHLFALRRFPFLRFCLYIWNFLHRLLMWNAVTISLFLKLWVVLIVCHAWLVQLESNSRMVDLILFIFNMKNVRAGCPSSSNLTGNLLGEELEISWSATAIIDVLEDDELFLYQMLFKIISTIWELAICAENILKVFLRFNSRKRISIHRNWFLLLTFAVVP